MKIFVDKMHKIEKHNKLYEEGKVLYKMGMNKFSDLVSLLIRHVVIFRPEEGVPTATRLRLLYFAFNGRGFIFLATPIKGYKLIKIFFIFFICFYPKRKIIIFPSTDV